MKKWIAISGLVVLLSIAGLVVFLGLPFLPATAAAQEPAATQADKPERVMILAVDEVVNGERTAGEVRVSFEDPAELPEAAEDAGGLFLSRDGDTLMLGTGSIEVDVSVTVVNDEEPETVVNASHSGDEVPVLVTNETAFYKDTTARPQITPADIEAGELRLARTVSPGSLDEIGENMLVRAWGTMADGVLVAELIVYEPIR